MAAEQNKTLDALKIAIQMEIDGKEFYLKASRASGNELGTNLLAKLADEEDIHRQVFENIYKNISDKKGWPTDQIQHDGGKGLKTIFSMAIDTMDANVKPMTAEIDAVQTAMGMENKTFDFYRSHAKKATYDTEKQFYEALAAQEEEHHKILLEYYEFLKDPAGYYVQKEHPSLDGG
jgi:rubrerythrin